MFSQPDARSACDVDYVDADICAADHCDVVIAGAGMAGLAAGLKLAKAGLQVVCIEPEPFPRRRVGESLDWSAPGLLEELGLPAVTLVADGLGTFKRELRAVSLDQERMVGRPPPWLRRWPLSFELATVHVDRPQFDRSLFEAACDAGVSFVWDRVERLQMVHDRVVGCSIRSGLRVSCRWFLDASGRARVLARAAGIGRRYYGIPRIALWSQFSAPLEVEATTLYLDDGSDQMSWMWEIPVANDRQSVGVVMPADRFRVQRRSGQTLAGLLTAELARFPLFRDLPAPSLDGVESRAIHSYVSDRTVGANWLMIGEAAAFIDPLTSMGVTAALRHASEASAMIVAAHSEGSDRLPGLRGYDRRVRRIGDFYNSAINTLLYSPLLRKSLGVRWAARAYVVPGYATNSLYARIRPQRRPATYAFSGLLSVFRVWVWAWVAAARLARRLGSGV